MDGNSNIGGRRADIPNTPTEEAHKRGLITGLVIGVIGGGIVGGIVGAMLDDNRGPGTNTGQVGSGQTDNNRIFGTTDDRSTVPRNSPNSMGTPSTPSGTDPANRQPGS